MCFDLLLPSLQLLEFDFHVLQFVQFDAGSVDHGLFNIENNFEMQYHSTTAYMDTSGH
jgi:hypothetical protein